MSDTDPSDAQLTRLLTDLANDPAAPPSTVDALSVIRAARAAAAADPGQASVEGPGADDPAPAEVLQFRPSRRRRTLVALVAAASLAGVAALVIPLSLSGGSSTNTSADAERAVAESAAGDLAAGAPAVPSVPAAAPDLGISSGPAPAAETAAAAGSVPAADGFAAGAACWPVLSEPVTRALAAALPAGVYGDPEPLADSCPAAPVGGALLPGAIAPVATATAAADSAVGTPLVVRISTADPGACVDADPVTGVRCVPQPDGTYLAIDGSGAPTVYVYGGGNEVAIGGLPDTGLTPTLSIDQLAAAAQAVLGALG